jgi:cytochrome c oxidase subunit 2
VWFEQRTVLMRRRWRTVFLCAAALGPLCGAGGAVAAPLNYFLHSAGPSAHPQMVLGWVFAAIVTLVCLVIALLLGYAIFRKRESAQPGAVGADTGGVRAVLLGTLISTFILFAMALYALVVLNQTAHPSRPARLVVTVTGYDWWWRASYPATQSSAAFVTANEIHIPVGQPVELKLESADVIHAFWVPLLAGKTQMIPGETNQQWLEADRAGSYLGQCTQFCGAGHARMAVMVVADAPADFERWRNAQAKPAMAPALTVTMHLI